MFWNRFLQTLSISKKATINKHNAHFSEPINCKEKLCITPTEWQSNEATFHLVSLCSRRDRQRDQNVGRGAARSCGKWKERFETCSRLCLTHTQKKFHQLRKLPPRACPLAHITYLMHCISSAPVKAFYGSITMIKLTTKVSKRKYHVLLYKHQ